MPALAADNLLVANTINTRIVDADGYNITDTNPLLTKLTSSSRSAFGEVLTVRSNPQVQVFLTKVNDNRIFKKFNVLGGSVSTASGMAIFETNTGAYGYAAVQSIDRVAYQPGVGIICRFTASFTSGVDNSIQVVGPYHAEEGFGIGFSGQKFGIMHRHGRVLEIQQLILTGGAAGTATVTLNGKPNIVTLATATLTGNAREITDWTGGYSDYSTTYSPFQIDNKVFFHRQYHGQTTGVFSYSNGGQVGTFSGLKSGANGIEDWHVQNSWNIDTLKGTGLSSMNIDYTKLNIYEFKIGWLGVLPIQVSVGDDNKQDLVPVHLIPWTNTVNAVRPHTLDPRFPIGYAVSSLGSTTNLVVKGASAFAAIHDGAGANLGPRWGQSNRKAGVTTAETPILSVMCSPIDQDNNGYSRRRVILKNVIMSNLDNTIDFTVNIYKGVPNNLTAYGFQSLSNYSILLKDTQATAIQNVSTATQIASIGLPANTVYTYPFDNIDTYLQPGEVLFVTAATSSSTAAITISINGQEDE